MNLLIKLVLLIAISSCSITMEKKQSEKRALIVVTNHSEKGNTGEKTGYYLSEVTHVYYPLIEAGFKVDFASPKGGQAPMDPKSRDLTDTENAKFVNNKNLMNQLSNTLSLKKLKADNYSVIHYAGGHGAMWDFPSSKAIERVTKKIYENGGIVSAVCHGPAALVNTKLNNGEFLVSGKKISVFTNAEEKAVGLENVVPFMLQSKLEKRGAIVIEGKNWTSQTSVSQRLITGQNPQSAKKLGKKIVELARKKKIIKK